MFFFLWDFYIKCSFAVLNKEFSKCFVCSHGVSKVVYVLKMAFYVFFWKGFYDFLGLSMCLCVVFLYIRLSIYKIFQGFLSLLFLLWLAYLSLKLLLITFRFVSPFEDWFKVHTVCQYVFEAS